MCAHFIIAKSRREIAEELGLFIDPNFSGDAGIPRSDVFPGQGGWVITAETMDPMLTVGTFGLIPPYTHSGEETKAARMFFNARIETIDQKPTYARPWNKGQRCIICATSFVEWEGKPGHKARVDVSSPDGRILMIPGVYEVKEFVNTRALSFSMLTGEPSAFLRPIVKDKTRARVPIILPGSQWLDYLAPETSPEDAKAMCVPLEGEMNLTRYQPDPFTKGPLSEDEPED